MTGVEPAHSAWRADELPLFDTRSDFLQVYDWFARLRSLCVEANASFKPTRMEPSCADAGLSSVLLFASSEVVMGTAQPSTVK